MDKIGLVIALMGGSISPLFLCYNVSQTKRATRPKSELNVTILSVDLIGQCSHNNALMLRMGRMSPLCYLKTYMLIIPLYTKFMPNAIKNMPQPPRMNLYVFSPMIEAPLSTQMDIKPYQERSDIQ